MSKLDVTGAYHRGTVKPAQVGAFAYVIPSAPGDEGIFICIDLVLPMGWVDSPKCFCAFSETLTDMANALVDSEFPVPSYGVISEILSTGPGPPHTLERLTHIYCYMDDIISVMQGGPDRQHRVFDGTFHALKWLFSSLPGELKDCICHPIGTRGRGHIYMYRPVPADGVGRFPQVFLSVFGNAGRCSQCPGGLRDYPIRRDREL